MQLIIVIFSFNLYVEYGIIFVSERAFALQLTCVSYFLNNDIKPTIAPTIVAMVDIIWSNSLLFSFLLPCLLNFAPPFYIYIITHTLYIVKKFCKLFLKKIYFFLDVIDIKNLCIHVYFNTYLLDVQVFICFPWGNYGGFLTLNIQLPGAILILKTLI